MKKNIIFILLIISSLIALFTACMKADEFPIEPRITSVMLSSNQIKNGDDFIITIGFEDDDGDLGSNENEVSAFFIDNRTDLGLDSTATTALAIPFISPLGNIKAISGNIFFNMLPVCCRNSDASVSCVTDSPADVETNTVVYDVYIMDRAGNKSNIVRTDPLTILCN